MDHLSKQVILRNKEERRIEAGHPWVFSNEIREVKGAPEIGDVVELIAASGKSLGIGFYHPHSLITFRLLSSSIQETDEQFFAERFSRALELRRILYGGNETFRLVNGEGDFLPGLIVDKFNDHLSVQTFSYGMDIRLAIICNALESLLHPAGIVERNESSLRELEKLPQKKGILRGSVNPTVIEDGDLKFTVNVLDGQKTGFFLDQRENRVAVRRYSRDADVLDCFCNEGGFALHAAKGGAKSVLAIDSSAEAVRRAEENAALNGLENVTFEQADVFEKLRGLASEGKIFDVVILDPPSFTKTKKNVQTAKQGYKELHASAFSVLKKGGILLSASCSHHIEAEVFLDLIDSSARKHSRSVQLLDWRGAAPDHPALPAMPETRYLKFGIFRVL